jgi:hypothetical protein
LQKTKQDQKDVLEEEVVEQVARAEEIKKQK